MIDPLYGEFLIIPIPLQLKGNWCSHECPYCYANLNLPTRKIDLKHTLNQLTGIHKNNNLTSLLLRDKYPVTVSNHSDPFSRSNAGILVPLMEQLTELDIPVFLQTRGGDEAAIAKTLEFLPPSIWYISVPHGTDETRQSVEPKAPSLQSRLNLITELIKKGHGVIAGLNPLVPQWQPNIESFLVELKSIGVSNIAIGNLHFNSKQKQNMKLSYKRQLGESLISQGIKKTNSETTNLYNQLVSICDILNLNTYIPSQSQYTDFINYFHQFYPKLFPTNQDFINHLYQLETPIFSGSDYLSFMLDRLPNYPPLSGCRDYIKGQLMEVSLQFKALNKPNFRQVMEMVISQNLKRVNILDNSGVSQLVNEDDIPIMDSNGYPVYHFNPLGTDYLYSQISNNDLSFIPFPVQYAIKP